MRRASARAVPNSEPYATRMLWLVIALVPSACGALRVGVVGANGRLGRRVVERLVRDGHNVRSLHRRPPAQDDEQVDVVLGDVTNPDSLRRLLEGCQACIAVHGATRRTKISDLWSDAEAEPSHARRVNYDGVAHLLDAARAAGCDRIVRVTGRGEKPWSIFAVLINGLGSMAKAWNYEGEQLLRSDPAIAYTVIRPGVMKDSEVRASLALGDDGADLKVAPISYAAVADLCVDVLARDNARRATLCATTADSGPEAWGPLLDDVRPDRREFPTSLYREHLKAVRVAGVSCLTFFLGFLALVLR